MRTTLSHHTIGGGNSAAMAKGRVAFAVPTEPPLFSMNPPSSEPNEADAKKFYLFLRQAEADAAALQPLRTVAMEALTAAGGWGIDLEAKRQVGDVDVAENIKLPGSDHGVVVLDGVFPAEWCAAFIRAHEAIGYTPQHELDVLTAAGAARQLALNQAAEEVCTTPPKHKEVHIC